MLNEWRGIGALTEDPVLRQAGTNSYFEFVILTDQEYKEAATGKWRKKYDPVRVVAWNKPWLLQAVRRGDLVMVTGRLQMRPLPLLQGDKAQRWDAEVVARTIENVDRYDNPVRRQNNKLRIPLPGTIYEGLPEDDDEEGIGNQ